VKAGKPVTNYKTVFEGEPAEIIVASGTPGNSSSVAPPFVQFEYAGSEPVKIYRLKPSGRYKIIGTVHVVEMNQDCKNGMIDKDGKVLSTEPVNP